MLCGPGFFVRDIRIRSLFGFPQFSNGFAVGKRGRKRPVIAQVDGGGRTVHQLDDPRVGRRQIGNLRHDIRACVLPAEFHARCGNVARSHHEAPAAAIAAGDVRHRRADGAQRAGELPVVSGDLSGLSCRTVEVGQRIGRVVALVGIGGKEHAVWIDKTTVLIDREGAVGFDANAKAVGPDSPHHGTLHPGHRLGRPANLVEILGEEVAPNDGLHRLLHALDGHARNIPLDLQSREVEDGQMHHRIGRTACAKHNDGRRSQAADRLRPEAQACAAGLASLLLRTSQSTPLNRLFRRDGLHGVFGALSLHPAKLRLSSAPALSRSRRATEP